MLEKENCYEKDYVKTIYLLNVYVVRVDAPGASPRSQRSINR